MFSSFIGGEGFAASSSHACAVRTLKGDVALGFDIARQYGWEARDIRFVSRCRSVMIIEAKIVVRKRADLKKCFYIFLKATVN
jgi:hypothetical protein